MIGKLAFLCASLTLATHAQAANLQTFVEQRTGSDQRVLGYPVPLPIESQTAVAGFRSHASLFARHQALMLESADMEGQMVGSSIAGRPIWAYRIGDADHLTTDGEVEGSLLLNGTIHAREWQSPEVATAIMEALIAGAGEPGLERFLLDNTQLVVLPVSNIDGFLQTQRYPTQVLSGDDPTRGEWPRDGRMRRKNMRGVDELLTTQPDHLFGIDLNRNHVPFWASNSSSSNNPRTLTYHGTQAGSEPESQAIFAAAAYADNTRLRFFADLHSFSRVLFSVHTGNIARDNFSGQLAGLFGLVESAYSPPGSNRPLYEDSPNLAGTGIGTTSEYFAYTYDIPTWTLEIEPGERGSSEYGFSGGSHDGFILPASQIDRVRTSLSKAQLLLNYRMAGPAYVRELRLTDTANGQLAYAAHWLKQGAVRRLAVARSSAVIPGHRYRLWLNFSKPMRLRENGEIAQIPQRPELAIDLFPRISLVNGDRRLALATASGRWLDQPGPAEFGYQRYRDDVFVMEFEVPSDWSGDARFELSTTDITGDMLDADPASIVDFIGGNWSAYQRSSLSPDSRHQIEIGQMDAHAIKIETPSSQVQEGDDLVLSFSRADSSLSANFQVTLMSDTLEPGDLREVPARVIFDAGQSAATLRIGTTEDLIVELPKSFSLQFGSASAGLKLDDRELFVHLVDNDRSDKGNWRVSESDALLNNGAAAASVRAAVVAANAVNIPVEIRLPKAATIDFDTPYQGNAIAPVRGKISIDGNGGRWRIGLPGRFFDVAAGGDLSVGHLSLERLGMWSDAGDGGLIRNQGRLHLQQTRLINGHGRDGGAIFSDGLALIERSVFVGGRATRGAQIFARGELHLKSSNLVGAQSGAATIHSEGNTVIEQMSLAESSATPALRRAHGNFSVRGSLISSDVVCDANHGVTSLGHNLTRDISCAFAASGDRQGVTDSYALDTQSLVRPMSAAQDLGPADCANTDLELRARPQGAAAARCDIGAIELGVRPQRGLWFDPARNGSGFAVEVIGNLLFIVWYTFDTNGDAIAYTAQNPLTGSTWEAPLIAFSRTGGEISSRRVGSLQWLFRDDTHADAQFEFDGVGRGSLALNYLNFAQGPAQFPVGGAWAAAAFPFQGFSIAAEGDTLAVVSYFYAADGTLRWALGTGPAADASTVSMRGFVGSCPTCNYIRPTSTLAGSIQLAFRNRNLATLAAAIEWRGRAAWSTRPTALQAFR